jgi:hypothetical protein
VYALTEDGRASSSKSRDTNIPTSWAALSFVAALPPDQVVELLRRRASRLGQQIAGPRRHINDALANDLHRSSWWKRCRFVSTFVDAGGGDPAPC